MFYQNFRLIQGLCEWCSFAKLLVIEVYIEKTSKQILKWSKYKKEFEDFEA
jgi:hypothetical protein